MNSNVLTYNQIRNVISSTNRCTISTCNNGCPYCTEVYYCPDFDCNNITLMITGRPCSKLFGNLENNDNVCLLFKRNNQVVTAQGTATIQENECANECCGDVTAFININEKAI